MAIDGRILDEMAHAGTIVSAEHANRFVGGDAQASRAEGDANCRRNAAEKWILAIPAECALLVVIAVLLPPPSDSDVMYA